MFDFLMESVIVAFSLGAVVGVVVTPHLMRLRQPAPGQEPERDSGLAKVPIRWE